MNQLALETPRGETQNHCFSGSRPAPARLCPLPVVPRGRMDHAPGQRRGRLPACSIPPSCIPASLWPACKNPPVLSVGVREGPDRRYRRVDKGCRIPLGSQGLKPWKVVQPQPSTLNQPPPSSLKAPTFTLGRVLASVSQDIDLVDGAVRLKKFFQLLLRPGPGDLSHKHLYSIWVRLVGMIQGPIHLAGCAVTAKKGTRARVRATRPRSDRKTKNREGWGDGAAEGGGRGAHGAEKSRRSRRKEMN